jgi:hypothetical protein
LANAASWALVSNDSAYAIYLDHFDAHGYADLYAATTDGTSSTLLLGHVSFVTKEGPCFNEAAGDSYFVVGTCTDGDGGTVARTSSFATGTWTRADLPLGNWFQVDPTGTKVFSQGAPLQWVPIAGGPVTTVDPSGWGGILAPDGQSVVYVGGCGYPVKRSPVVAPAPETLIAGSIPVTEISLSPDGRWLTFSEDPGQGDVGVFLGSATKPGNPVTLSTAPLPIWPSFTGDSSFVLYSADYSLGTVATGTLMAAYVHSPAPFTVAQRAGYWASARGSKVVLVADYEQVTTQLVTADLELADLATGGAPPALLVSSVNPRFSLTPSGDRVVYTTSNETGPAAGLYVAPVP